MQILFAIFYEIVLHIKDIKEGLEHLGCSVDTISILKLGKEGKNETEIADLVIDKVNKINAKYVFFFLLPYSSEFYSIIKNKTPAKFIFYNFDDPCSVNSNLVNLSKYMDIFINPNPVNNDKLRLILNREIKNLPMFIAPFPEKKTNIEYDVAFIYSTASHLKFPINDIIYKVKTICAEEDLDIILYGPNHLESLFPDIYLGTIDDCVYSKHKLIIEFNNTYDARNKHDTNYLKIIADGNILVTNIDHSNSHMLKPNINCLEFNSEFYLKMPRIIKNYKDYQHIKINAKKDGELLGIDNWCQNLLKLIV